MFWLIVKDIELDNIFEINFIDKTPFDALKKLDAYFVGTLSKYLPF